MVLPSVCVKDMDTLCFFRRNLMCSSLPSTPSAIWAVVGAGTRTGGLFNVLLVDVGDCLGIRIGLQLVLFASCFL